MSPTNRDLKIAIGFMIAVILLVAAWAKCASGAGPDYTSYRQLTVTTTVNDTAINLIGSSVVYHKLTGNVSGTVSACSVKVDTSPDKVTWTPGGAVTSQTCTSNFVSSVAGPIVANYVRISVTSFTGTGSVVVAYSGYVNAPSGGGTITNVTGTAPIVSSGGNSPAISCVVATGSVAGCLAAADFTTFNAKQPPLSSSVGLTHQFMVGFTAPNTFTLAQPLEDDISFSDITTNNASTSKHGYVPKLPNDATKFYDGTGNYSVPPSTPSAGIIEITSQRNSGNCSLCASKAVAYPGNNTATDLLIVTAGGLWASNSTITIADTAGDTFTSDASQGGGSNAGIRVWHTCSAVGGANTVTVSGFPSGQSFEGAIVTVQEFSGNATTSCLTQTGGTSGDCVGGCSTTSVTAASVTTTNVNDLIFAVLSYDNRDGNVGVSSPLPTGVFANGNVAGTGKGLLWTSGVTRPAGTWGNTWIFNTGVNSDAVSARAYAFKSATGSGCLLGTSCSPVSGFYSSTGTSMTVATPDLTMVTVGSTSQLYRFTGEINCTTTTAAATASLNLKWTDTSNTAQTFTVTDTCTTLGASSVGNTVQAIRVKNGTSPTWGVSIVNTPTYDADVRLEAL